MNPLSPLAQSPREIFMIRPACFGFNAETAATNHYQDGNGKVEEKCGETALREFDAAVAALRAASVNVTVFEDDGKVPKPDAVFPNNWISMHETGEVVLYPMATPNRRIERRGDVVAWLQREFEVSCVVDFSHHEGSERFLEGTGSIVFDHESRNAYACKSLRTEVGLFQKVCEKLGYTPVVFDARDEAGRSVYHTNVVLAIGQAWVVVSLDAVRVDQRNELVDSLGVGQRVVVEVSQAQVNSLAANCYEVVGQDGRAKLVISTRAWNSLEQGQQQALQIASVDIVHCCVDTIERVGGGGIRCMIAPIFNKRKGEH